MILQWLMNHHRLIDILTEVIAICSVLHTFMPPWDWDPDFVKTGLLEFPTAQAIFHGIFNNRWYRFLVYVIGFIALNGRSTIWKGAISIGRQLDKARADARAEIIEASPVTVEVQQTTATVIADTSQAPKSSSEGK